MTRSEQHTAGAGRRRPDALATVLPMFGAALVALAGAGCAALRPAADFALEGAERYALDGAEVTIYQPAGSVTVEPGAGPGVEVEVARYGPDAEQLRVLTERDDDGAELSVAYPDTAHRIVFPGLGPFSRDIFFMRGDGTFGHGFPPGRRVTVARAGDGVRAFTRMRVRVPPGTALRLYLGAGHTTVRNVRGALEIDSRSARVDVAGTRGSLDIDTGLGPVAATDVVGPIAVNTGSGDVTLTRVRGDRIRVKTGTGGITGADVTAHALEIDTGIGAIRLAGVRADALDLEGATAPIHAAIRGYVGRVEIDGGSGDVTLALPAGADARLELETDGGDIVVPAPATVLERGDDELVARLGRGGGFIDIETDEGAIRIVER